jgi:pimeloyl-ACP methyl ester carboxylesterase
VFSLDGVGHAPFWQAPDRFNPLLKRFVGETAL